MLSPVRYARRGSFLAPVSSFRWLPPQLLSQTLGPRLGKSRDSQSEIDTETSEGQVMKIGTVRWFNLQKGYGYIHPDDGSPNVFVDRSVVESAGMSDLMGGDRVTFEFQRDERTGKASAVSLKSYVIITTAHLDDRVTTNPFDIISAFISSTMPRVWP